MKAKTHIWIITSSVDIFSLFRFLWRYDFAYTVFFDQEGGNWTEKENDFVIERVKKMMRKALDLWVEKLILPPMLELYFLSEMNNQELEGDVFKDYILPVYTMYIQKYCIPNSLVWKLWIIGDYFDDKNQHYIKWLSSSVALSETQKETKKFHNPLSFRFQQVRMWKYFTMELWWKNRMMHNVVKRDLRKMLDAWVDTIIPCNYWYFVYDKTIKKMLATKKCRWHWLDSIEEMFASVTQKYNEERGALWVVSWEALWGVLWGATKIVYTWQIETIIQQKKMRRLLEMWRGDLITEKIDI